MATDKELVANNLHRLSNQFNIINFGQALFHSVLAFLLIFPHMSEKYPVFARVGATVWVFWCKSYSFFTISDGWVHS